MANTIIYQEDWETKLQERLAEPSKWKDICRVEYTDSKVLHNPYMSDATVQTGTRGSAYTHQDITVTDQTVDITTFKILPQLIDRADLAQQTYVRQMEMADYQGQLLNEAVETGMYAEHAQFTDFDNASIGGSAGNITVTVSNVEDIIRGIKREIREANGEGLLERNGGFIVWRPADFEMLEAVMQASGFVIADKALDNGAIGSSSRGINFMGMTHYSSNKLTSGHLFAGVKGLLHLGICKSTYGQVIIDQEPAVSAGAVSGIGIISRVDYKFKAWSKTVPVLFDVLVA